MMTETQVKIVRLLIAGMIGISLYQAYLIGRLTKELNFGRQQFDKARESAIYLLEIIDKNDIELTEFDLIALTAISEGKSDASS
jgi:hypothetical protein